MLGFLKNHRKAGVYGVWATEKVDFDELDEAAVVSLVGHGAVLGFIPVLSHSSQYTV